MDDPEYHVFLSYNHREREEVERIAEALVRAGLQIWFDDQEFKGGEQFASELAKAIWKSAACAVFIGPNGLGKWGELELNTAIHRDRNAPHFRVFPVLLPGLPDPFDYSSMPEILRGRIAVDLRAGVTDARAFQSLLDAIDAKPTPPIAPPVVHNSGGRSDMVDQQDRSETLVTDSYLIDNIAAVQRHIKEMAFTPVLGAGCSLVGRSQGVAWNRISERIEALLSNLSSDEAASRYLRSMATLSVYDVIPRSNPNEPDLSLDQDPLARLQIALVKLGAGLGELFAQSMMTSVMPVWDTQSYRLAIPRDHPNLEVVARLLLDACVAAHDVKALPDAKEPASGLEAHGLYDRLVELSAELTDRQVIAEPLATNGLANSNAHHAVFREIEMCRRRPAHREPWNGIELSLHQLEWVADALWHTLRYDKAAYPRSDELAFQISLLASGVRGRRPEVPTAAEAGRVHLSPQTVAAWFRKYSESPPAGVIELYDALAHILFIQFKGFRASDAAPATNSGGQPVAFSTTFDLEMERALHRRPDLDHYHVVIPINAYLPGDTTPEPRWLVGTTSRDQSHAPEQAGWTWLPEEWHPTPNDIKGPILIKLHGSPLHILPPLNFISGGDPYLDYNRIEHALVLSESEYLQSIVWKDRLPGFFNNILQQPNRAFFFLGHSLTQWNTRLRLFSQVYRPASKPRPTDRIAITRSHDPYRSAVLNAFKIHRWIGDLDQIPRIVDSTPL